MDDYSFKMISIFIVVIKTPILSVSYRKQLTGVPWQHADKLDNFEGEGGGTCCMLHAGTCNHHCNQKNFSI